MYDEPASVLGGNSIYSGAGRSLSKKAPSLHGREILMVWSALLFGQEW